MNVRTPAIGLVVGLLLLGGPGLAPVNATNEAPEDRTLWDHLVIGFHAELPEDAEAWVASMDGQLLRTSERLAWISAEFPDTATAATALRQAQAREDVRYVQHDAMVTTMLTPNDPMYGDQWGYAAIDAPEAWETTLGSHDVKVATLDTGLDTDHQDIQANACGPFESFVPSEAYIEDENGHGTHVSGTVAAATDDGLGVAGTSQSCLMHGKVLDRAGWGLWTWVAAGVEWAADNGADVISMSLGGNHGAQVLQDAVNYAYLQKDVLIVSAAGNSYCGGNTVSYPAAYEASMAVAALDPPGDSTSAFSSCGDEVDIAAPGSSVLSTYKNGGYDTWEGTSMAAPHVAGVAGLIKAVNPEMSAVELRCVLYVTADDLLETGRDDRTGFGRVNAAAAVGFDVTAALEDPTAVATDAQALAECTSTAGTSLVPG